MKFTSMNLLEELARPEFAELLSAFRERTFARNTIIFQPEYDDESQPAAPGHTHAPHDARPSLPHQAHGTGEAAGRATPLHNFVFIVRRGRVRVYLAYDDKEFTIAILQPGDIYTSHTNTFVQALDDCTVLLTDIATFHRRMMDVPQFTKTMVRVLGGILKNAFGIIDGLVFRDATARLAAFLLDSAEPAATAEVPGLPGAPAAPAPRTVTLNMTGELLAQHLGTTRQTVSTLLNDFTRSGILHRERRGVYHILDEERLRELTG